MLPLPPSLHHLALDTRYSLSTRAVNKPSANFSQSRRRNGDPYAKVILDDQIG